MADAHVGTVAHRRLRYRMAVNNTLTSSKRLVEGLGSSWKQPRCVNVAQNADTSEVMLRYAQVRYHPGIKNDEK